MSLAAASLKASMRRSFLAPTPEPLPICSAISSRHKSDRAFCPAARAISDSREFLPAALSIQSPAATYAATSLPPTTLRPQLRRSPTPMARPPSNQRQLLSSAPFASPAVRSSMLKFSPRPSIKCAITISVYSFSTARMRRSVREFSTFKAFVSMATAASSARSSAPEMSVLFRSTADLALSTAKY